jgi:hypothetical protein
MIAILRFEFEADMKGVERCVLGEERRLRDPEFKGVALWLTSLRWKRRAEPI